MSELKSTDSDLTVRQIEMLITKVGYHVSQSNFLRLLVGDLRFLAEAIIGDRQFYINPINNSRWHTDFSIKMCNFSMSADRYSLDRPKALFIGDKEISAATVSLNEPELKVYFEFKSVTLAREFYKTVNSRTKRG
tara:strand:+ start:452 stop:856 length:405 start_codon:yes stop_codon:yes gene_type:complete